MAYDPEFQEARDALVKQAVAVQAMAVERNLADERAAIGKMIVSLVAAHMEASCDED